MSSSTNVIHIGAPHSHTQTRSDIRYAIRRAETLNLEITCCVRIVHSFSNKKHFYSSIFLSAKNDRNELSILLVNKVYIQSKHQNVNTIRGSSRYGFIVLFYHGELITTFKNEHDVSSQNETLRKYIQKTWHRLLPATQVYTVLRRKMATPKSSPMK